MIGLSSATIPGSAVYQSLANFPSATISWVQTGGSDEFNSESYLAAMQRIYAEQPSSKLVSKSSRDQTFRQITEIAKLNDDWDGYGGYAPSVSVCSEAHRFVALLASSFEEMESPEVCPTANGTITFAWDSKAGTATVELGDAKFSAYIRRHEKFIPLSGVSSYLGSNELELISECLYR